MPNSSDIEIALEIINKATPETKSWIKKNILDTSLSDSEKVRQIKNLYTIVATIPVANQLAYGLWYVSKGTR